jgi:hypothetical protein
VYPQRIRDLFTQAFTDGLTDPGRRVTEKQWMDAFSNLFFGIMTCPCDGGTEVFYDEEIVGTGAAITCWNCQNAFQPPMTMVSGKSRVLLMKDAKLCSHHTAGNYDIDTVAGTVVQNPNNPSLWGIRNDCSDNWTYIKTDGTQIPVAPGKSAAIVKGAKIDFGRQTGEFI